MDRADDRLGVGLDLVHQLHRLEDAERLPRADRVALLDERRRAGLRRAVEGADHRRLDADEAVARRLLCRQGLFGFHDRSFARRGREDGFDRVGRPPHGDAHAAFVDRDLSHTGFLDDADDLANPFGTRLVDAARRKRVGAGVTPANRFEQRSRLLAEEGEQQQLLVARSQALGFVAQPLQVDGLRFGDAVGKQLRRTADGRIDRSRRRPVVARDQPAELVDHRLVARRREHVQERLRAEDLADRSGEWRPAHLLPHAQQLLEDLVQPVAGGLRA